MPFNYDDISNIRYNPFVSNPANRYTPKKIGYGANPPETHTIDSIGQISLYEYVQETLAQTVQAKDATTAETLTETTSLTPAKNQFSVCYDELGNGIVQFHSSRIGHSVQMKYYAFGTRPQRSTLKFQILSSNSTKIVASSDSSTGSQEIANEIILTTEDAGAKINSIITELSAIGGGEIKILEGTFKPSTLITGANNIKITGSGNATLFLNNGITNSVMFDFSSNTGCQLSNFKINNDNKANSSGIGGNGWETRCSKIEVINSGNTGFSNCYGLSQCIAVDCTFGFSNCNYSSGCEANSCGTGFSGCSFSSNLYSHDNSNDGFSSCFGISNCYAYNNGDDGYTGCTEISSCQAYLNGGEGFFNCDRVTSCNSSTNSSDGYQSCENITSCRAGGNVNGFDGCKAMGFNYSTGNSGSNYTATCFADRAGLLPVADDANGGFNG